MMKKKKKNRSRKKNLPKKKSNPPDQVKEKKKLPTLISAHSWLNSDQNYQAQIWTSVQRSGVTVGPLNRDDSSWWSDSRAFNILKNQIYKIKPSDNRRSGIKPRVASDNLETLLEMKELRWAMNYSGAAGAVRYSALNASYMLEPLAHRKTQSRRVQTSPDESRRVQTSRDQSRRDLTSMRAWEGSRSAAVWHSRRQART